MALLGYSVTCANKNQSGNIVRIGGEGWSLSKQEAVQKIVTRQMTLYIALGNKSFYLGVRGEGRAAHLVLEPDGTLLRDIDLLGSC